MRENHGLSIDTMKEIVDLTGDAVAGKLVLLGDGSLNRAGFIQWAKESYASSS